MTLPVSISGHLSGLELKRRLLFFALLAVVSALPILFLMPLFGAPFDRDQGLYGVIARGWLHGAVPYRDMWDNKGPVLFLWYMAAFKLLGETVVAPRLLAAIGTAAAVPFVWSSSRTLLGPRTGLLAALLFAIAFANPFLQANANAEILMLCPLAAGFWAFTNGAMGHRQYWFVLAGVLTALAALTKQAAAGPLAGYGLWLAVLALRYRDERIRHIRSILMLGVGALLGLAPFIIYFAANGALYDFWYATVQFNMLFSGQNPIILKLLPPLLLDPAPLLGGLLLWVLAVVGGIALWKRRDRAAGLILSFAGFSELAAQSMGKVSAHYSVGILPAAAILGAVGFDVVLKRWREGYRKLPYAVIGCGAVSVIVSGFLYAWPSSDQRFVVQYTFRDYAYRSLEARNIAARVDALTGPEDYVYEFGRQSDIYFLADRKPASRWLHNRALEIDPNMLPEVLRDLDAHQPKLVLLTFECVPTSHDFTGCEQGAPQQLKDYLTAHYRYDGKVEYADFYVRIDSGTSPQLLMTDATGGQSP
jgi:4-amino-4-deoxy-L-arabinose transferase-like glycosyltransferase